MRRKTLLARLVPILVLLITAAFYRLPAQEAEISPSQGEELFAQIDDMLASLSEITGLEVRKPIPRALITKDEIRELVQRRIAEESNPEEIRLEELFLKKFGLVGDDFDLAAQIVDVVTEQATALYDFKTKKLYLATWTPPDMQEFALVHELAHALADQHFDLQKYVEQAQGADGDLARLAVLEGQASWIMTEYVLQQGGRSMVRNRLMAVAAASSSRIEAENYPVFSSSPLFMQETILFPYTSGLLFQQALVEKLGKSSFEKVFRNPPLSSQQILEPAAYLQGWRPTRPRLPKARLGRTFKKVAQGEVGQLDHFILLKEYFDQPQADELAPKWRGGRYVLKETKSSDQTVLLYSVEWETPTDAARYFDLYKQICQQKWQSVRFDHESQDRVVGRAERGGFVLSRKGAVFSSVEGLPDDKLE